MSGAVVIDLKNFQQFSMDPTTWRATAGAGTLLGDLQKRMHEAGNRAMAHGICPQVGIGGHATSMYLTSNNILPRFSNFKKALLPLIINLLTLIPSQSEA